MITTSKVPPEIATAATTMLSPYFRGLTTAILIDALGTINEPNVTHEKPPHPQKPYTRKGAAEMLGVSIPTVDRYMASGRLTRVRYSARAVRISAESVHKLMEGDMA